MFGSRVSKEKGGPGWVKFSFLNYISYIYIYKPNIKILSYVNLSFFVEKILN